MHESMLHEVCCSFGCARAALGGGKLSAGLLSPGLADIGRSMTTTRPFGGDLRALNGVGATKPAIRH